MPAINRPGQVVICTELPQDIAAAERVAAQYRFKMPRPGDRHIVRDFVVCRGCGEVHSMMLEGFPIVDGHTPHFGINLFRAEELPRSPAIAALTAIANGAEPGPAAEDTALYRRPPYPDGAPGATIMEGASLLKRLREQKATASFFQQSPVLIDRRGHIISGRLRALAARHAGVAHMPALVLIEGGEKWPASLILQPHRVQS